MPERVPNPISTVAPSPPWPTTRIYDFREVLVLELVALAVTVRPQQGLEHRGDDFVPVLARHVAVEIPLLRSGCCPFRQLVHHLLLHALVIVVEHQMPVNVAHRVNTLFDHQRLQFKITELCQLAAGRQEMYKKERDLQT